MPDLMAIVSKAVFEKQAGKDPAVGARLGMDRYVSANKNLAPLAAGGRLYLVTVRPPDEALWLVAILDQPKHDGTAWVARACDTPLTDISDLRAEIKFESGTGITAKAGALGMSLQTPRALTAEDTALLDAAAGGAAPAGDPADPQAAALLGAILADPGRDDARRIYADLLGERGDPRGEFIQLDIALAGPLSIRKRELLAARRAELSAAHQHAWFPAALAERRVRRGFLEAVTGDLDQLAAAARLFATEPVVEVAVTDLDEDSIDALLAAAWLPRVRHLILRGAIGDDGFARLAAARPAKNLRALNVSGNELGPDAMAALTTGLPRCRHLVLTANPLGDEGVALLASWGAVASLESLYLSACGVSAASLGALLGDGTFAHLDKLCLSDNDELGDEAAEAIAAHARNLPALRYLELRSTGLRAAGLAMLLAAPLPSLRRLDVRKNYVRADDPRVVA